MEPTESQLNTIALGELGHRPSHLRLRRPAADERMRCSLEQHGQLSAVVTIRILAGQGQVAHTPSPAAGAHCVDPSAALSWEPGLGACGHHVYLGTDEAAVATADDPDSLPGQGEQLDETFNPGPLSHQTHYF